MAESRHPDRLLQGDLEGGDKGPVSRRSPLETDPASEPGLAHDPHQVVIADRMQDRRQEVLPRPPFGEQPAQVAFHIDRAAVGDNRASPAQGQLRIVPQRNPQPAGLFFDERTGARGADN